MKKLPLVLSLILNMVLIVALVALYSVSKKAAFRAVADFTAAEVRLQEHILTELQSGDSSRIDMIQEALKRNIENGKKASADWKSAANW